MSFCVMLMCYSPEDAADAKDAKPLDRESSKRSSKKKKNDPQGGNGTAAGIIYTYITFA